MKLTESLRFLIFISAIAGNFSEIVTSEKSLMHEIISSSYSPYPENIEKGFHQGSGERNVDNDRSAAFRVKVMETAIENSHNKSASPKSNDSSTSSTLNSSSPVAVTARKVEDVDHHSPTFSNNVASNVPSRNQSSTNISSTPMQNSTEHAHMTTEGPVSKQNTTTPSSDDVVLHPTEISTYAKALLEKSLAWMNDTYTMSIVFPIAAGFVFAAVVIVLVSFVNCMRRRCCRRRFRRKHLPDSIRNMKPSDRARLLAETSDEEF